MKRLDIDDCLKLGSIIMAKIKIVMQLFSVTLFIFLILSTIVSAHQQYATATFAGGCFWCMEKAFGQLNGVIEVVSGYTGGSGQNPTYEDYAEKGHIEAVQIIYDPSKITYSDLLNVFWRQIDPTDAGDNSLIGASNIGLWFFIIMTNKKSGGKIKRRTRKIREV